MSNFVANLLSEELRASFYSNSKDVEIICSKDNSCNIHKAVLCAVSPFLGSIFGDDEDVKIILPDYSPTVLDQLLQMIYFGEIALEDFEQYENLHNELLELSQMLGIEMDLAKIQSENPDETTSNANIDDQLSLPDSMEIIDVTETQIINNSIDVKSELTYHCTVEGCTSHFFTHVALRKHVETVHKTYTFACHLCGKRYRHKFSLKEHLAVHKSQKSHLCDLCGAAFSTKSICANHKLLHGNRKLSCPNCNATFKQRNVLHQHKISCQGIKKYKCDICQKKFTSKQNRDVHLRIHTGEFPYQCDLCQVNGSSMKFRRIHHFKKHLQTLSHINLVTKLKTQNQEIPPHLDPKYILGEESGEMTSLLLNNSTCDICPKADGSDMKFKSSYHFHKHIRSRAHMDRILQQSQLGLSIPEHLVPPSLMTQDQNVEVEETSDILVIAQESIQSE